MSRSALIRDILQDHAICTAPAIECDITCAPCQRKNHSACIGRAWKLEEHNGVSEAVLYQCTCRCGGKAAKND